MAMGEAEYLEQRLDDQINWYGKKSAANQAAYKRPEADRDHRRRLHSVAWRGTAKHQGMSA